MGSGARAGGESPKAGWEARGTHNLGVLLSDDDDGTCPGPLKEGVCVEKCLARQRTEGRDSLRGAGGRHPCQPISNAQTRALLPRQGQSKGKCSPLCVCWVWLPLPLPVLDQLLCLLR